MILRNSKPGQCVCVPITAVCRHITITVLIHYVHAVVVLYHHHLFNKYDYTELLVFNQAAAHEGRGDGGQDKK